MSRSIVAGLGLGLALAVGCAGTHATWQKPGVSAEQREKDQSDCMNAATLRGDPGSVDPNVRAGIQRDFENCMLRRGYKLTVPAE
jgi:hypothetical protein